MLKILFVALAALSATRGFALVSAYGLIGKSVGNTSFSDDSSPKLDGVSLMAGVHFDPIPLVPVSAGLALRQSQFSSTEFVKDAQLFEAIPEVKAWLPLSGFAPYAKLGYVIYGKANGTYKSAAADAKFEANQQNPYYIALGLEYHILPLIGIVAEYQYTASKWKYTKYEIGGRDFKDDVPNSDTKINTYAIGVSVGL